MGRHRWAILGAGGIARRFATALAGVPDGELVAVGSSDPARGRAAADELGAAIGGSYEDAVAERSTIAYIANDHPDHGATARIAIDAGCHVLVEKPFACTRAEAASTLRHARSAGLFAMEAMWTRFLPFIDRARDLLASGTIGTVRRGSLELGRDQRGSYPRIFDPARAGGALLDMGVYPIAIAHMLLGPADEVLSATARIVDGVDLETWLVTRHGDVEVTIGTAADRALPGGGVLDGDTGSLVIPDPLHNASSIEIHRDGAIDRIDAPFVGNGLGHEIEAVHASVEAGRFESPAWPHDDTFATHAVMDEVRRRIGLIYPFEIGPAP